MSSYKLSFSLTGHEMDVRAVAAAHFPEGAIVTGSRDRTTRLWIPDGDGKSFHEGHCMSGHENFISAICIMPPSDKYEHGLIVTGSNDHKINAYSMESPQPVFTLTGHANTVCSLASGKFGTLLSGSWDNTAKVWLNQRNVMTLTGHEAAVWSVALMPTQGLMLTGSADKTIKLWRAGKCEKTFEGHQDCVRAVAVLSELEFLSASNDTTVRRWLITGECTQQYHGHTNFIYSISILPNGQDFVTSGEDRTLRVWQGGECTQAITLPTQSVWCVTTLMNGDIVTGSSDGVARVFTADPGRVASAEALELYNAQLASFVVPAKTQAFAGIKMEDLPGKKDLDRPGTKDGQTKLVRIGDVVEAYSWSAAESKWTKIGDVVGDKDSENRPSTNRVMYEGKEYDYVFDVDIEEGKPPLKLPYNTSEDPWHTAQRFIHANDLSQVYLEQVANFIVDNTKGVTLGAPPPASGCDPFTGSGRYIPGGRSDPNVPQVGSGGGTDPFTGSGRYIPGSYDPNVPRVGNTRSDATDPLTGGSRYIPMDASGAAPPQRATQATNHHPANPFFPKTSIVRFDSANPKAILEKVKEFNATIDASMQMDESTLNLLAGLLEATTNSTQGAGPTAQQMDVLWKLLQWPIDKVFPAIDILRLAIRHPVVSEHFCNHKDGEQFVNHLLLMAAQTSPPANRMLVFRTLCNAFVNQDGRQLMESHRDNIFSVVSDSVATKHKNMHIAMATLILNFAVQLHTGGDVEAKSQCLSVLSVTMSSEPDPEASFRLLVAMGTLMSGDDNSVAIAKSLDILPFVTRLVPTKEPAKVGECSKLVAALLN